MFMEQISEPCCWICHNCSQLEFLNTSRQVAFCDTCQDTCSQLSPNKTSCVRKSDRQLTYRNHWVLTAAVFATIGQSVPYASPTGATGC